MGASVRNEDSEEVLERVAEHGGAYGVPPEGDHARDGADEGDGKNQMPALVRVGGSEEGGGEGNADGCVGKGRSSAEGGACR